MNEKGTDVLQQYDLDIIRTSRVRGAVLCETRQGCRLLKEYKGTDTRMDQVQQVLIGVEENCGVAVDKVIPNREGGWISRDEEQTAYVVKEWNGGRECDLNNEEEILQAVGLLAKLHKGLRMADSEAFKYGECLAEEYGKHTAELRRARNFVRRVRHKSEFELALLQSFQPFYEQAEEAARLIRKQKTDLTDDRGTSPEERQERDTCDQGQETCRKKGSSCGNEGEALCHGEYNHHHILYDGNFAMVTDFMAMTKGIQAGDLYDFMRKVMEKRNFCCRTAEKMLEEYDRRLTLGAEDRRYLYVRFLYPEKYWKQINYYLNSNKAWFPPRNTEKLRKLQEQEGSRQEFLRCLQRNI